MKKTAFDELKTVFDDLTLKNVLDDVELPTEEKVIFSPEMSKLIREEIYKEISNIPIGKIVSQVMLKEAERRSSEDAKIKESIGHDISKTKDIIEAEVKKESEKLSQKIRKKYDDLKNELISIQSHPRYEFGGFAPPNPVNSANNTFLTNTNGTWAGLTWSSFGIGSTLINGTAGSVLFIDSSGNLAQNNSKFFWDNTNERLGIGTNSPIATIHTLSSVGGNSMFFESTADGPEGPSMVFQHSSPSPAAFDSPGAIVFGGKSTTGASRVYADISAVILDPTNGNEDGAFYFGTSSGGSIVSNLRLSPIEAVFNYDQGDTDFRILSDSDDHAFFLQGSDGFIGIGTDTPLALLHVDGNAIVSGLTLSALTEDSIPYISTGGLVTERNPGFTYDGSTVKLNVNGTSDFLVFYDTNGQPKLTITKDGELDFYDGVNGINTPGAHMKLGWNAGNPSIPEFVNMPSVSVNAGWNITENNSNGSIMLGAYFGTRPGVKIIGNGNITGGDHLYVQATTGRIGIGPTVTPTAQLHVINGQATTIPTVIFQAVASQTAVMLQLQGVSSTSTREQVDIDTAWATSTDATRKARGIFRVWDTAAREAIRIESDGSQAISTLNSIAGVNQFSPQARLHVTESTLGNEVLRLDSTASNDDPSERVFQNKVTTTDATTTTIATVAIPSTTTVMIEARVTARRTGGSSGTVEDGAAYIVAATYKNVAGTATEIGETALYTAEDQAGWNVTFTPSSGNALIQVTGAANNNISWVVTYRTYPLSI